MQLGIRKRKLVVAIVIFTIMILSFPLLSEAIDIEQQKEIIKEEPEDVMEMLKSEEQEDTEESEEIEEVRKPEKAEETQESMEEIVEIEDEEEWEIVIVDEPIPVDVPNFSQTETVESTKNITQTTVLPKTGAINPVPQSVLGTIMIYLGLYINKKNKYQKY